MKIPQKIEWQIPYKKNISTYAKSAGIQSVEVFSEKETEAILVKIVDEYKEGKLPLDELAMTCEILSSMSPKGSDIYWALIDAAEIEWYINNSPTQTEGSVDSLMQLYLKIKKSM